jgi:hypothetical protein
MAGTLIVSNITTDTDNTFIVRSNTGTTLFSANTTGIDTANSLPNTGVTAGSYGSSTLIPVLTVNAKGLVTAVSNVSLPQVVKPSIISPANNATGIQDTQLITATSYLSLFGRSQANAQWQISTSPSFAFINVSSTISGSNTEFQVNASSGLVTNTVHYARVRYSDTANNSSEYSDTVNFTTASTFTFPVNFLVLAGGGGGSANRGAGGGGAGGYRASLGTSGGPSSAESALSIQRSTNYTVTVGAGGAGGSTPAPTGGANGSPSIFSTVTSLGGGVGGSNSHPWSPGGPFVGAPGGSGGGGGGATGSGGTGGSGTPGQGNPGGTNTAGTSNAEGGAGGGGAGAAGTPNSSPNSGTAGGAGISSDSLFGPATTRGGGGGGGGWSGGAPGGSGGGGTGQAGPAGPTSPGTTNTGGGGGGGGGQPASGGSGGSGIVLLQYPSTVTLSNPGGGLTYSTAPVSGNTVATFTAGTGNVSWSI